MSYPGREHDTLALFDDIDATYTRWLLNRNRAHPSYEQRRMVESKVSGPAIGRREIVPGREHIDLLVRLCKEVTVILARTRFDQLDDTEKRFALMELT